MILHRFAEASTWAALAAAFGTISAGAPPEMKPYLWGAASVCVLLGVLLREGPK
jgi:hypothetical protein